MTFFFSILNSIQPLESMTYSEDTLVSRKPTNDKELKISDIATKVKIKNCFQSHWRLEFKNKNHLHFLTNFFALKLIKGISGNNKSSRCFAE